MGRGQQRSGVLAAHPAGWPARATRLQTSSALRAAGAARVTRRAGAARQMAVQDPPAFHIFYATGWRDAVLRVRTLDADGAPQTPVRASAGGISDRSLCGGSV